MRRGPIAFWLLLVGLGCSGADARIAMPPSPALTQEERVTVAAHEVDALLANDAANPCLVAQESNVRDLVQRYRASVTESEHFVVPMPHQADIINELPPPSILEANVAGTVYQVRLADLERKVDEERTDGARRASTRAALLADAIEEAAVEARACSRSLDSQPSAITRP